MVIFELRLYHYTINWIKIKENKELNVKDSRFKPKVKRRTPMVPMNLFDNQLVPEIVKVWINRVGLVVLGRLGDNQSTF